MEIDNELDKAGAGAHSHKREIEKPTFELTELRPTAQGLKNYLAPYCERIEIAGSIRRGISEVKDIEIVLIQKPSSDMFSKLVYDHKLVYEILKNNPAIKILSNGKRWIKVEFITIKDKPKADIFIVSPPAQFGAIFALRTGPAEYSKKLVTQRKRGGLMPSYLRQKNGALWNGSEIIYTPTEQDYFDALGIAWIDPGERGR